MLIKIKTPQDCKLNSQNAEIEEVKQFCFDDEHWPIHYLIIDTLNWMSGKKS